MLLSKVSRKESRSARSVTSDIGLFVDVVRKRIPQLRCGFLGLYDASNFEAFFQQLSHDMTGYVVVRTSN